MKTDKELLIEGIISTMKNLSYKFDDILFEEGRPTIDSDATITLIKYYEEYKQLKAKLEGLENEN